MILNERGVDGFCQFQDTKLCIYLSFGERSEPFPTYNKSAADDVEDVEAKVWKISINEIIIIEKIRQHCGKMGEIIHKQKILILPHVFKCFLLQMC